MGSNRQHVWVQTAAIVAVAVPAIGMASLAIREGLSEPGGVSVNSAFHLMLGVTLLLVFVDFLVAIRRATKVGVALALGLAGFATSIVGGVLSEMFGPLALAFLFVFAAVWAIASGVARGRRARSAASAEESGSELYYHGTRADLKPGDLIEPGYGSNFGKGSKANFVYLTATLDAATWGAELALGEGPGRIYIVEPTGSFEDDPNLTDKKFPGNPTKSYRTREPLKVVGEVTDWEGHAPEVLKAMKDHLELLKEQGIEAIND